MMKNKYVIDGDTLIVYNRKDNREMLFDADDFDKVNQHTWCIAKFGKAEYIETVVEKKVILVHRMILNAPKDKEVDHINGNKLDNRKSNLRLATSQINKHNYTKAKGYSWCKRDKRFKARIVINYKTINLGDYKTEDEARKAYLEAKAIYHPTAPIHLYK